MFKTVTSRIILIITILCSIIIGIDFCSHGAAGLFLLPLRFVCGVILLVAFFPVLVWVNSGK